MKVIVVVVAALVAVALAEEKVPQVVRSDFQQQPDGPYNYLFESENGIKIEETGSLKQTVDEDNKPVTVLTKSGSYSYTDPEGKPVLVTYVADEGGFQASGDVIPQAPARR